ncbi:MAG: hypothetical protein J2P48_07725 [Alphaproteobacteria bacterium]|nr:hypothetical protein [Alphaproteobacteria bacterium]
MAFSAGAARAQVPVPGSEFSEISACLCLQQSISTLAAEMNAKKRALDAVTRQLAALDAQLAQERPLINVNNPDAVARYKALLEQHDATYRRSIGPVHADAVQATARYNAAVNEFNSRCVNPNRPLNWALAPEAQSRLMCPPLR